MALETRLVTRLIAEKIILVTVESCTGGLLASRITDIAGASTVFWGSWCVYDNSAKTTLGIPFSLIEDHGAVSTEVARALAETGLRKLQETLNTKSRREVSLVRPPNELIALSTTGIAGPGGGTPEKPVGLCYLGLASSSGEIRVEKIQAPAGTERTECKRFFSERALELLSNYLDQR